MVDIGTGDARFVLRTARAEPETLVIGIDADARSMMESGRRAARKSDRGGAPNARFIVSSVEALPDDLPPIADRVTIHFPWAALLRGLIRGEPEILRPLARIARPGALVTVLASVTDTERATGLGALDEAAVARMASASRAHDLDLVTARPATDEDVRAAHSTWAKRLGAGTRRETWLLELARRA